MLCALCFARAVQIFSYFIEVEEGQTEEEAYEVEITPAQFKDALDRLCPNVFNVTDKELAGLIAEFDTDGNGTISISEFRDFCYRIPHLAWKAERMRYERQANEEGRSVSVRPTKAATPVAMPAGSSAKTAEQQAKAQEEADRSVVVREIYSGTKVFWHAKEKLEIKILEVSPPNKPELAQLCKLQAPCLVMLTCGVPPPRRRRPPPPPPLIPPPPFPLLFSPRGLRAPRHGL